jgi:outer membrane protein assembly factor BamE (lipoprotein component of BamABCDE complex)
MNSQRLIVVILAGLMIATAALASGITTPTAVSGQPGNATKGNSVVRDSSTILLDGKTIPAKDFIHLYDSTPYKIMNGHIASKLPCDANSASPLKILVGQAPNVKPASLELVKELSKPGSMCIYHIDIPQGNDVTTDIAIQNPTGSPIKLPDTSTVVIGVNEITPLATGGQMGNMTK